MNWFVILLSRVYFQRFKHLWNTLPKRIFWKSEKSEKIFESTTQFKVRRSSEIGVLVRDSCSLYGHCISRLALIKWESMTSTFKKLRWRLFGIKYIFYLSFQKHVNIQLGGEGQYSTIQLIKSTQLQSIILDHVWHFKLTQFEMSIELSNRVK